MLLYVFNMFHILMSDDSLRDLRNVCVYVYMYECKYLQYSERKHAEPDVANWNSSGKWPKQGPDKIITEYFLNCMHSNLLSYNSNLPSIITTQKGYAHIQLFQNTSQNGLLRV